MIRTKTTEIHKSARCDIINVLPSFVDFTNVLIRFCDTGSTCWINVKHLEESEEGEIQRAIDNLRAMRRKRP